MAEKREYKIPDEILKQIEGGVLPPGWKKLADAMVPGLKEQYGDLSYEEAKKVMATFITDPDDFEKVAEYAKKYFPEFQ